MKKSMMKKSISPGVRAVLLLLIPIAGALVSITLKRYILLSPMLLAAILLILAIDIIISNHLEDKYFSFTLDIPQILNAHCYNYIKVSFKNSHYFSLQLKFLLKTGVEFDRVYADEILRVNRYDTLNKEIKLFCNRRGVYNIDGIYIRAFSPLQFFNVDKYVSLNYEVSVIPGILSDRNSFKSVQNQLKSTSGMQKNRMIGDGSHFEMLRDYQKSDEYGKIDWKATARKGRPVTRVFRTENRLDISIMIDCGRLLSSTIDIKSILDYSVDAALILSYSAIKWGDSISITGFADKIISYVPPSKDIRAINKINYQLANLDSKIIESNYKSALNFINAKLTKRSLIVIFTDIIDNSNAGVLKKSLSILQKKHNILLVFIKDKSIFELADGKVPSKESIYTKIAAVDLVIRREKTILELKKTGVKILDLLPEEINSRIISEYVYLKKRL